MLYNILFTSSFEHAFNASLSIGSVSNDFLDNLGVARSDGAKDRDQLSALCQRDACIITHEDTVAWHKANKQRKEEAAAEAARKRDPVFIEQQRLLAQQRKELEADQKLLDKAAAAERKQAEKAAAKQAAELEKIAEKERVAGMTKAELLLFRAQKKAQKQNEAAEKARIKEEAAAVKRARLEAARDNVQRAGGEGARDRINAQAALEVEEEEDESSSSEEDDD